MLGSIFFLINHDIEAYFVMVLLEGFRSEYLRTTGRPKGIGKILDSASSNTVRNTLCGICTLVQRVSPLWDSWRVSRKLIFLRAFHLQVCVMGIGRRRRRMRSLCATCMSALRNLIRFPMRSRTHVLVGNGMTVFLAVFMLPRKYSRMSTVLYFMVT